METSAMIPLTQPLLEACVESLEEAQRAQDRGAHRLELCARLDLDGLTPSMELIRQVSRTLQIPVKVMIRPRAGNFIYDTREIEVMKADIEACRQFAVHGVVFGVLTDRHQLDLAAISQLAGCAAPLEVTIHKAIDHCSDPVREIRRLKKIHNVHAVLTSGKAATASEGQDTIRRMIMAAEDRIKIIAAGKITSANLEEIHTAIGAMEYHGRRLV